MSDVLQTVLEQGVVAIVRATDADSAHRHVFTLIASGVRVVEISLVTPGALDVIRSVRDTAAPTVHVGVGTALNAHDVIRAHAAGAEFVVAPTADESTVRTALNLGLLVIPGAATPSEACATYVWGAQLTKLFPASLWSPGVLKEMLTALPQLKIVPTGGVTAESAASWIRAGAGAVAVGMGGALTRSPDPSATVRELFRAINEARQDPA